MALLSKVADCLLHKGGMFGAGILGVLLWKENYLPNYAGAISLCATSVGFCVTVWYISKAKDKKQESSKKTCKEIIEKAYRESQLKMEERLAQQDTAGEVVGTNEHSVDSSKGPILSDEVDDEFIRESTLKELELLAKAGGLAEDVFKRESEAEAECKGEVLQASQLFQVWDTKRNDINIELSALVWRGKGVNVRKTVKPNTRRSIRPKSGKISK